MHKYRLISKKGEGTFSEVLKAQSIKNGKYLAIKCMKNHFDSIEQVNNLREIQALRRLSVSGSEREEGEAEPDVAGMRGKVLRCSPVRGLLESSSRVE